VRDDIVTENWAIYFSEELWDRDPPPNYFDVAAPERLTIRRQSVEKYLESNPGWFSSWLASLEQHEHVAAKRFAADVLGSRLNLTWTNALASVKRTEKRKAEACKNCGAGLQCPNCDAPSACKVLPVLLINFSRSRNSMLVQHHLGRSMFSLLLVRCLLL
jgi:hypothetical protein